MVKWFVNCLVDSCYVSDLKELKSLYFAKLVFSAARGVPLRSVNYWLGAPALYFITGQGSMLCNQERPCPGKIWQRGSSREVEKYAGGSKIYSLLACLQLCCRRSNRGLGLENVWVHQFVSRLRSSGKSATEWAWVSGLLLTIIYVCWAHLGSSH